jgi:hypothetical protein
VRNNDGSQGENFQTLLLQQRRKWEEGSQALTAGSTGFPVCSPARQDSPTISRFLVEYMLQEFLVKTMERPASQRLAMEMRGL